MSSWEGDSADYSIPVPHTSLSGGIEGTLREGLQTELNKLDKEDMCWQEQEVRVWCVLRGG